MELYDVRDKKDFIDEISFLFREYTNAGADIKAGATKITKQAQNALLLNGKGYTVYLGLVCPRSGGRVVRARQHRFRQRV
jgi:hypothetical protein